MEDVNTIIPLNLRNKINVRPRMVWQIGEKDIDQKAINEQQLEINLLYSNKHAFQTTNIRFL